MSSCIRRVIPIDWLESRCRLRRSDPKKLFANGVALRRQDIGGACATGSRIWTSRPRNRPLRGLLRLCPPRDLYAFTVRLAKRNRPLHRDRTDSSATTRRCRATRTLMSRPTPSDCVRLSDRVRCRNSVTRQEHTRESDRRADHGAEYPHRLRPPASSPPTARAAAV